MKSKLRKELEAMLGLHTGNTFTADHVHTLANGIFAVDEGGGFKYIRYDNNAFPYPQTIGKTADSINGLGYADETMMKTIFIMPNKSTDSDATLMIVVDEKEPSTDPKTYQYVYVGNINDLPSDVLTEENIVDIPGTDQESVMSQKGATDLVSEYNVSTNNNNTEYTFAQAVALVPASLHKGGLTIKYIDNTTHKYAIKRLMSSTWNTTESNWQGIDDEPTAGSDNLVKSGGVYEELLQNRYAYFTGPSNPSFKEFYTKSGYKAYKHISVTLPSGQFRIYDSKGRRAVSVTCDDIERTISTLKMLVYDFEAEEFSVIDYGAVNEDKYYVLLAMSYNSVYGLLASYYYNWKEENYFTAYLPSGRVLNGAYSGKSYIVYAAETNLDVRLYMKNALYDVVTLDSDYTIGIDKALIVDIADNNAIKVIDLSDTAVANNIILLSNLNGGLGGLLVNHAMKLEMDKKLDFEIISNYIISNLLLMSTGGGFTPSSRTIGDTITVSFYESASYKKLFLKCKAGTSLYVNIETPSSTRPALYAVDENGELIMIYNESASGIINISQDCNVYINAISSRTDLFVFTNKFDAFNLFDIANPYGVKVSNQTIGLLTRFSGTYDNSSHSYKSVGTIVYKGEIITVNNLKGTSPRVVLTLVSVETGKLLYIYSKQTLVTTNVIVASEDCYLVANDSAINTEPYNNPLLSIQGVDVGEAKNRERAVINAGNPLWIGNKSNREFVRYLDNDFDSRIKTIFDSRRSPAASTVSLIHFSDLHGNSDGLASLLNFKSLYADSINDVISTGDIIESYFSDGSWDNLVGITGVDSVLEVIGNHDGATSVGSFDWEGTAKTDVYNRYIEPYVANWGVTQPANAEENGYCWFYKDYVTQKLRLIVLDCIQTDYTAQTSWLASVLNDALTNEYSVVIAQHCRPDGTIQKIDGFNSGYTPNDFYANLPAVQAVDAFIENGGDFVCWIGGHTHYDSTQIITDHHNQLSIIISTDGGTDKPCDYIKEDHHESIDLFNVISFNTESKVIRVLRVGAHISDKLQDNRSFSVNWETKEVWK